MKRQLMISTMMTSRLSSQRGGGGRFRRVYRLRETMGIIDDSIDIIGDTRRAVHSLPENGDRKCSHNNNNNTRRTIRTTSSLSAPMRLQTIIPKNFSSSSIAANDSINRSYSSSTTTIAKDDKSGGDHHSLFQEQMLELQNEQRQYGPIDDDENTVGFDSGSNLAEASFSSPPETLNLEDQMSDWKAEQLQVFGETLADHDDGSSSLPDSSSNHNSNSNSNKRGNAPEMDPDEREARFDFTPEDVAAWGKPNPSPGDMRQILGQVALEREKEASYAQSASLSPPSTPTPTPSSTVQDHHESFSHVSGDGSSVHMVDVGSKATTARTAHARSEVWLPPDVLEAFASNDDELVGPKGPIFATAKIAGIMASKKTSELIPLCHPLPLDQVTLDIGLARQEKDGGGTVVIDCTCKVTHKTGVEMEALTGATVAALTIYDMTKAVSHNIRIKDTRLVGKTGGKRTVLDGIEDRKHNSTNQHAQN